MSLQKLLLMHLHLLFVKANKQIAKRKTSIAPAVVLLPKKKAIYVANIAKAPVVVDSILLLL